MTDGLISVAKQRAGATILNRTPIHLLKPQPENEPAYRPIYEVLNGSSAAVGTGSAPSNTASHARATSLRGVAHEEGGVQTRRVSAVGGTACVNPTERVRSIEAPLFFTAPGLDVHASKTAYPTGDEKGTSRSNWKAADWNTTAEEEEPRPRLDAVEEVNADVDVLALAEARSEQARLRNASRMQTVNVEAGKSTFNQLRAGKVHSRATVFLEDGSQPRQYELVGGADQTASLDA
jgi:hypothetical protein